MKTRYPGQSWELDASDCESHIPIIWIAFEWWKFIWLSNEKNSILRYKKKHDFHENKRTVDWISLKEKKKLNELMGITIKALVDIWHTMTTTLTSLHFLWAQNGIDVQSVYRHSLLMKVCSKFSTLMLKIDGQTAINRIRSQRNCLPITPLINWQIRRQTKLERSHGWDDKLSRLSFMWMLVMERILSFCTDLTLSETIWTLIKFEFIFLLILSAKSFH